MRARVRKKLAKALPTLPLFTSGSRSKDWIQWWFKYYYGDYADEKVIRAIGLALSTLLPKSEERSGLAPPKWRALAEVAMKKALEQEGVFPRAP